MDGIGEGRVGVCRAVVRFSGAGYEVRWAVHVILTTALS